MKVWVVEVPNGEFLPIHATKESAEKEVNSLYEEMCADIPAFKKSRVSRFYIISESEVVE